MPSFAIIIPCYNEAKRIKAEDFIIFGKQHADVQFFFVNDGSTDETLKVLEEIQKHLPQTEIISLQKNSGKAEAIRQGMLMSMQKVFSYIGYLDADLSTPLEEFYRLLQFAFDENADVILGSRIKKIDTTIERSYLRHITGRMIATLIDKRFRFGIYDTQCGAKVFKPSFLENVVSEKFFTKWFFDVEIFLRIKKHSKKYITYEIPLKEWHNKKNSKLNILSFPSVIRELFVLLTKY